PAHRELIRAKEAGREPDAAPGVAAKQRSVHNNYLTLPVVFTMLAGHFPLVYGSGRTWLVLVAIFVLLALTRHFFNLWHTGRRAWWIPAAVGVGAVALAIVLAPDDAEPAEEVRDERALAIVGERCQSCHAGASAPAGVRLETIDDLRAHAGGVQRQVSANAMPPGNATGMTDDERAALVAWAAAAR
ncbi:MAG TPA: urate hydroxylase PuuD, partial [Gaiellaceae bacterium]|nr:urate hydroxylase PuuD [Gaiellaceae bacterium]